MCELNGGNFATWAKNSGIRRLVTQTDMAANLNFIVALAACVGSIEAIRQTQAKSRRQEHRSRKNNLVVHCSKSSRYCALLEGRHVVLSGNKVGCFFSAKPEKTDETDRLWVAEQVYIDTGTEWDVPFGHPFAGYYHPFPESQFEGLVTTICDDPSIL